MSYCYHYPGRVYSVPSKLSANVLQSLISYSNPFTSWKGAILFPAHFQASSNLPSFLNNFVNSCNSATALLTNSFANTLCLIGSPFTVLLNLTSM